MKEKFVGRWKLLSCIAQSGDEKLMPFGDEPFGMLLYTPTYMSVFLAKSRRTNFSIMDMRNVPSAEIVDNFPEFEAYCGNYSIDESTKIVIHRIENSKVPNWINMDFRRYYQLQANNLILKTVDSLSLNGRDWHFTLEWEKAESF